MPNYRRAWQPGGTWFFTVTLLERRSADLLIRHIAALRKVVASVKARHPFIIHAWVVLPEHIHCILQLPPGDSDFALRWRLIKSDFSKQIPPTERLSATQQRRGERGIWQRRYWEHLIRNEADLKAHIDYVHYNPLKHGLVTRLSNWRFSTFHRWLAAEGLSEELISVPNIHMTHDD